MLRSDQPREDRQPPARNQEIVISSAELHAAQLHDAQPPAIGTVVRRRLLQLDPPVRHRVRLRLWPAAEAIIEQQHSGLLSYEVLLERKDLPAKTERVLRQQAQLGQRIKHDARGV